MTWIETITFAKATGKLKDLYKRVTGPGDNVDNIMLAHSLRPHTMEGHMGLYKATIHHHANSVPKWFLETLGVWVSILNGCDYCVEHHFSGLSRLLNDSERAAELRSALEAGRAKDAPLEKREIAALFYARRLAEYPKEMSSDDIDDLRNAGWEDGEILEINQVVAYFCYANRTVLGLGVTLEGDDIGLSPNNSDDPDDWGHS